MINTMRLLTHRGAGRTARAGAGCLCGHPAAFIGTAPAGGGALTAMVHIVPFAFFLSARTHQLWVTPHGILKAAEESDAAAQIELSDFQAQRTVLFTRPGALSAKIYLDADYLVGHEVELGLVVQAQLTTVDGAPPSSRPYQYLSTAAWFS